MAPECIIAKLQYFGGRLKLKDALIYLYVYIRNIVNVDMAVVYTFTRQD